VAFENGNAIAVGTQAQAGVDEARAIPFAEQLLRLGLHFFFFSADERDDVGVDIHGGHAGIARAGDGLERDREDLFETEGVSERLQDEDQASGGTIRVGDDETAVVTMVFLLRADGVEMRGVYFRDEQGNVGIHAVILGVADDGIARAGEVLFSGTSDARIERGKNEVALEAGIEAFYDEATGGVRDGSVEVPANGFGVSPA